MLTELSKVNAPSLLLTDFNYFFNKAINNYINKRYNIYDVNQQTTDDLRVLTSTVTLDVYKATDDDPLKDLLNLGAGKAKLFGASYKVKLPQDYFHLLNCICIYKVNKTWECYDAGNYVPFPAKKLTGDSWSVVMKNAYNCPLPERPYYYINNWNINSDIPTNPLKTDNPNGTDMNKKYSVTIEQDDAASISKLAPEAASSSKSKVEPTTGTSGTSNFPRTIELNNGESIDVVNRETAQRYGNASNVIMDIRYGNDDSVFTLVKVLIDYIKTPQHIRLTQEQIDLTEDTSQIMEFPDYVCQEIINELTHLVMENTADPRLQTHPAITQSIANPTPQQPAPQQRTRQE